MIPKMLNITGLEYNVEQKPGLAANRNLFGEISFMEQVISIDSSLKEDKQHETLLHEIIEALNNHHELELEHHKISTLAVGLFQVLRDNGLRFDDSPKDSAINVIVNNPSRFGTSDTAKQMPQQLVQEAYDLGRKMGGA